MITKLSPPQYNLAKHNQDLKQHPFCPILQENVKIADYGLACMTSADGLCNDGGTPGYRAPEVIRKGERYNKQVRIFYGANL